MRRIGAPVIARRRHGLAGGPEMRVARRARTRAPRLWTIFNDFHRLWRAAGTDSATRRGRPAQSARNLHATRRAAVRGGVRPQTVVRQGRHQGIEERSERQVHAESAEIAEKNIHHGGTESTEGKSGVGHGKRLKSNGQPPKLEGAEKKIIHHGGTKNTEGGQRRSRVSAMEQSAEERQPHAEIAKGAESDKCRRGVQRSGLASAGVLFGLTPRHILRYGCVDDRANTNTIADSRLPAASGRAVSGGEDQ